MSVTLSSAKRAALLGLFLVAALWPLEAQSGTPTLLPNTRSPRIHVGFGLDFFYPLARFSDISTPAYAPTAELRLSLNQVERFEPGLRVSYVGLDGREPEIDQGSMFPVLATLRYRLLYDRWFALNAVGGMGVVYSVLNYDEDGVDVFQPIPEYEEDSGLQVASSIGLEYRLSLGRLFSAAVGWSYFFVFEDAGPIGSLTFPLGLGIGL